MLSCKYCGREFNLYETVVKVEFRGETKYYCKAHVRENINAADKGGIIEFASAKKFHDEITGLNSMTLIFKEGWSKETLRELFLLYNIRQISYFTKKFERKKDSIYSQISRYGISKKDSLCTCGAKTMWIYQGEQEKGHIVYCISCKQEWVTTEKYAFLL